MTELLLGLVAGLIGGGALARYLPSGSSTEPEAGSMRHRTDPVARTAPPLEPLSDGVRTPEADDMPASALDRPESWAGSQPADESAATARQPVTGPDGPATAAAIEEIAIEVLDVADRLSSDELARRLAAAVDRLPGLAIVRPDEGDAFDPDHHLWAETIPVTADVEPETISRCLNVGLKSDDGTSIRPARVVVHDA